LSSDAAPDEAPPPVAPATQTADANLAPSGAAAEASLLQIVDHYHTAYDAAANDMAKGVLRPVRAAALCSLFRSFDVEGWRGTVATLSATSDGKGVLAIQLPGSVTVSTTNNGLSDSVSELKTLIPVGSAVQMQAMALHVGQQVQFSGTFARSDDDCLEETSFTVNGAMTSPEFLFRFSDVRPAD
jgi:hypothetical protein